MEAGYRHLTSDEVSVLKAQGCWAEDWQHVYVSERFTPESIVRVNFYGVVRLGAFSGSIALPGGLSIHSGIYDATLFNVNVDDDALITHIHGYIANYDIGPRVYICDVGKIYMEGVPSFGVGTRVNVLPETGGREVAIYEGLSAQTAYLAAMYRHLPELTQRLQAMADLRARAAASERGFIGPGARIENVGIIRNVRIGEAAVLQGCLRLFDGTVVSSAGAPVLIGSGTVCTDFIIQSGSVVEDGAVVTRCFVGQSVTLAKGFSCSDSLFFANSRLPSQVHPADRLDVLLHERGLGHQFQQPPVQTGPRAPGCFRTRCQVRLRLLHDAARESSPFHHGSRPSYRQNRYS